MKKAILVLPMLFAMSMSGCSILNKLLGKSNSSSGSESGQSGDNSGSGSGSGSGTNTSGGGAGTNVTFNYSSLGLSANVESSYTKTISGKIEVTFPGGVLCNTTYEEFGLASNALMTIKALDGKKITKIIMDNYKYYNDCPMYAGESASGSGIVGTAAGADSDNHNKVTWNNLNNAAYTYKNTHTGNSWTYSVTVTIA